MRRNDGEAFRAYAYRRMFDHLSELRDGVAQGSIQVFALRDQTLECSLGGSGGVNGSWTSVLLVYGSWDDDDEHVRVTTRVQDSETPEMDFLWEHGLPQCVPVSVHIAPADAPLAARLYQVGRRWCTSVTVEGLEVVVSGVGNPPLTVGLERLTDLGPAIEARLDRLRRGGFPI